MVVWSHVVALPGDTAGTCSCEQEECRIYRGEGNDLQPIVLLNAIC